MSSRYKVLTLGMMFLISANVLGAACYFVLKVQLRREASPPSAAIGGSFPRFSGVDVYGLPWSFRDAPCRVIRMTADNCSFCIRDRPAYDALLASARNASCEILEMSPKSGQMAEDPRPGVVQLKFVSADLGSVLSPFVTPHTVILDRDWSLKWTRRGMLDQKSLASGIATLNQFLTP